MEIPVYLKNIEKLSEFFEQELKPILVRKELPKGDFLFRQGEICQEIYFVEKGLLRNFYYSNSGKEVTAWFFAENSFLTAIDSFFYQNPTRDNCEALEDTVVYAFSSSDLEGLLKNRAGLTPGISCLV